MSRLAFAEVWRETFDDARRNYALYATLAAAFVLLPAMALRVFGPAAPKTIADLNGSWLAIHFIMALIGALAQLGIAGLATGAAATPSAALRRAVSALPGLAAAGLITAFALMPSVFLIQGSQRGYPALLLPGLALLIPGLFVVARLSLGVPLLATRTLAPTTALRLSWTATAGNGWRILGVLAASLGMFVIAMLLAGGVAAAFGSVLTLFGATTLGGFVAALISAAVASAYTIVNSALLAVMYRRLADKA
jgi:hypothetical protein